MVTTFRGHRVQCLQPGSTVMSSKYNGYYTGSRLQRVRLQQAPGYNEQIYFASFYSLSVGPSILVFCSHSTQFVVKIAKCILNFLKQSTGAIHISRFSLYLCSFLSLLGVIKKTQSTQSLLHFIMYYPLGRHPVFRHRH